MSLYSRVSNEISLGAEIYSVRDERVHAWFARRRVTQVAVLTILLIAAQPTLAQNYLTVSADGTLVAFVKDDALWLLRVGQAAAARRIASVPSYYATPRWAPSGHRLAFYSAESGTLQLWLYDEQRNARRQITFFKEGVNPLFTAGLDAFGGSPLRYSWSPDSTKIALSTQVPQSSGKALDEIHKQRFPTPDQISAGHPIVLTSSTPPEWTLHGVVSYGLANDPLKSFKGVTDVFTPALKQELTTQIFVVDIHHGSMTQLTDDNAGYFTPEWSPDGGYLAYMSTEGEVADKNVEESNIFTLSLATGERKKLTTGRTQKVLPLWSPGGEFIAYRDFDIRGNFARRHEGVYVITREGNAAPRLVSGEIHSRLLAFDWTGDGSGVVVSYWDGMSLPLVSISLSTGDATELTSRKSAIANRGLSVAASPGGAMWAELSDPNGAITLRMWRNKTVSSVLEIEPPSDPHSERRAEVLQWTNQRGDVLDGLLIYPHNYSNAKKYPLIVDAYGMVFLAKFWSKYGIAKMVPNYFVFKPNHRAPHLWLNPLKDSVYTAAAVGPKGISVMADDILSGVDAVLRKGGVDATRLGLFGFSNGGMEGLQLLTETNRFRCAVIQSPSPADWLTYVFLNYPEDGIRYMYGIAPWEDAALYTSLTPLFHADSITTPLLIATGDREPNVLAAIKMYNALRFLQRDVTLLRYPMEGHGFAGNAMADFEKRVADYYATHFEIERH